jgi:hypothetical protein
MRLQVGAGEATDRAPRPAATAISEKGFGEGLLRPEIRARHEWRA